jgi:hypothetical protein
MAITDDAPPPDPGVIDLRGPMRPLEADPAERPSSVRQDDHRTSEESGLDADRQRVFFREAASIRRDAKGRAPYSIWRRMALAEARQVEMDMAEAAFAGTPYPENPVYDFGGYLMAVRKELDSARSAASATWPNGIFKRIGYAFAELIRVWTGSEHETAVGALHRAEGLMLMVMSDANLRSEALKVASVFNENDDIRPGDPRHNAFEAMFVRIESKVSAPVPASPGPSGAGEGAVGSAGPPPSPAAPLTQEARRVASGDRVMLRELRRSQNEAWEISRSRLRIFRNILSGTIPFLTIVLLIAAVMSWRDPTLVSLRPNPGTSDVALVEFLGAFGGLLSAVATIRSLRNYQRFYGLPLAQTILKLPAGAATALVGIILLQHGLLGITAVDWEKVIPYALAFGIAQIAVTKRIDSRATDLLGDANSKSLGTSQTALATAASDVS